RGAAADPAALLRGARGGAARLLAATRRAARADGLRANSARLRDVDVGEARPRPRVDRRPLGSALPTHVVGDRRAPAAPTVLDVEPRVLEVEVAAHAVDHIAPHDAGAAELGHSRSLRVEQLTP